MFDPYDIIGNRYSMLYVKSYAGVIGPENRHSYLCVCDCGNETIVRRNNLLSGNTRSCGCLHNKTNHTTTLTHGDSRINSEYFRLYRIWGTMRRRCNLKTAHFYEHYGGRGISVCDEWNNYEYFKEWAISNGYDNNLTLDRIDVNGDYCPSNCRWVSYKTQERNRRNNHNITFDGKTQCLSEWAEETGIPYGTLNQRININHWTIEDALTRPVQKHTKN